MEQGPRARRRPAAAGAQSVRRSESGMAAAGATLNVFVVVFLVLMIWKPGY